MSVTSGKKEKKKKPSSLKTPAEKAQLEEIQTVETHVKQENGTDEASI